VCVCVCVCVVLQHVKVGAIYFLFMAEVGVKEREWEDKGGYRRKFWRNHTQVNAEEGEGNLKYEHMYNKAHNSPISLEVESWPMICPLKIMNYF